MERGVTEKDKYAIPATTAQGELREEKYGGERSKVVSAHYKEKSFFGPSFLASALPKSFHIPDSSPALTLQGGVTGGEVLRRESVTGGDRGVGSRNGWRGREGKRSFRGMRSEMRG